MNSPLEDSTRRLRIPPRFWLGDAYENQGGGSGRPSQQPDDGSQGGGYGYPQQPGDGSQGGYGYPQQPDGGSQSAGFEAGGYGYPPQQPGGGPFPQDRPTSQIRIPGAGGPVPDRPTSQIRIPGSGTSPAAQGGPQAVHAGVPGGGAGAAGAARGGTATATAPRPQGAPGAPKADEDDGSKSPVNLSPRQIGLIIAGLMLGMFLSSLDQTIVSTSMRTIADDLHGLSIQAWVSTAYLVALSVTTPLYGKLSDMYGRKPFFVGAISIFVLGSLACACANSMWWLAASRGVQGLGAGGLVTLGLTIIADIAAPRDRPKYQGVFMAVYGTSSVLGPLLGGLLSGQDTILGITGWRWVFLVNVPTGAAALVVVGLFLKLPPREQRPGRRIDWWGAVLLPVCLVPVLVVAEQGDDWGWLSVKSIVCYAIGVVGLIGFLVAQKKMNFNALVPLKLFSNPTFRWSMITASLVGVGMFGGILLVPQYLQIVRGASPTEAGLMTVPMMFGIMIGSVFSGGGIARSGHYKIFVTIGTLLIGTGLGCFYTVHVGGVLWRPMLFMVIFGIGLGFCMQTLTAAAQNSVPVEAMGLGTALVTFFRQIGGSLGVAALLSTLFHTVSGNIADAFKDAAKDPKFVAAVKDPKVQHDPNNAPFFKGLNHGSSGGDAITKDSSFLKHLDSRLANPFKVGFLDSIHMVMLIAAGVMVVAFIAAVILKEVPIRAMAEANAVDEDFEQQLDSETVTLRVPLEYSTMTLRVVAAPEETTMTIPMPRRWKRQQQEETPWQESPPKRLP
jgi:EmrB/QacA subfamily drug resistance transporter